MKVVQARLVGPERIELAEVDLEPRPEQVVVRNLASGICHSERAGYLAGPPPGRTGGLGHEPVGEIAELGSAVEGDWSVGERVTGYWGPGCATYAVADPGSIAAVPESLPTHHAIGEVLACLVTCGRGWNHEIGADLCLVGCGFMGVMSMSAVRHTGRTVTAIDLKPDRLSFAARHGATNLVRADESPVEQVRELTSGRMCQVVTEASGVGAGLDLAVQLVGGFRPVINLISYLNHAVNLKHLARLDRGVVLRNPHPAYAPHRMEELRIALELAARGTWDLADAITHTWSLEQCDEAYRTAMSGADGYTKGLVTTA